MYWKLFQRPTRNLLWWMLMWTWEEWILVSGVMLWRAREDLDSCQFVPVSYMLTDFQLSWSLSYWGNGAESSATIVYLSIPFGFCKLMFYVSWYPQVRCPHIYGCHVFFKCPSSPQDDYFSLLVNVFKYYFLSFNTMFKTCFLKAASF